MTRKVLLALAVLAGTASVALAASSPSVKTGSATSVKQTSAVLNGTINPNGSATKYWFQWGLSTTYGSTTAVHTLSAGTKVVSVHLTASGLSPDVKYHYRLVAQNASGATATGADRTFTTTGHPLPVGQTQPATGITFSSASINGLVDPNGQSTQTEFQYGPTPTLTTTVPGPTVPATTPLQAVSTQLTGLADAHTFYYRVLVRGAVGTWVPGQTLTFTTLPFTKSNPGLHAHTSPRRDPKKPFVYTTSGSISGPFPANAQCTGTVALRYFAGGRQRKARFVPVQPNCTFSQTVIIFHTFATHHGGPRPSSQRLQIQIRFRGNGYLAPKSHNESVVMR
jgi:hypothetical protein